MNLCAQHSIFISTRTSVRTEGLLTQLVFEHSLRIRLKAEASNETIEEDDLTVIGTQDSVSVTEGTSVNSGEGASQSSQPTPISASEDSSGDSQSASNGKDKEDLSTLKSNTRDKEKAQNLIGKINNLVTTDLGNVTDGKDFLMISTLRFFTLSLGQLSDNPASPLYPIPISSVRHLLI